MSTEIENHTISSLRVHRLFGRFDHEIYFPESNDISIITAPNGYGKTVLLRILDSIFNRKLGFLGKLDFAEIEIQFSSNKSIFISQINSDEDQNSSKAIVFRSKGFGSGSKRYTLTRNLSSSDYRYFERHLPLEQMGPDRWFDYTTERTLSTDQVVETYSDHIPRRIRNSSAIPEWLQIAISSVNVHLVETQRLLHLDELEERRPPRRRKIVPASVVERDASDLSNRIGRLLQRYANESQKLDQTFPERILEFREETISSEVEIRNALQNLTRKRDELISVGLLGSTISEPIRPSEILQQENVRRILEIYVEDTSTKLSLFDETYEKIRLFKKILEERFSFKDIEIEPQQGIRALDLDSGQSIPLSELSSGEQHELVLIYDLIFTVEEGSHILIDEPELSLHVSWQKKFIGDLERIQKIRNMKVLIATHSPQIIHNKWTLVQELTD